MKLKSIALGAILSASLGAGVAMVTSAPVRPSETPHSRVQTMNWSAHAPQVGETCLGTVTAETLEAYGIKVTVDAYKAQLYPLKADWPAQNEHLADRYLRPLGLHLAPIASVKGHLNAPILVALNTAALPWWKVSSVQGSHEIVIVKSYGHGAIQVLDPAFGRYFNTTITTVTSTAYYMEGIQR